MTMKKLNGVSSPRGLTEVGLAVLVTALCLTGAQSSNAAPPDKSVTVVNTAENPVPVVQQGTTSISGEISISGTADVNVVNSPTVQVGNTSENPVPVAPQGTQNVSVVPGTTSFAFPVDLAAGQTTFLTLQQPLVVS